MAAMQHLEVRAVHSVPAFVAAIGAGTLTAGVVIGIEAAVAGTPANVIVVIVMGTVVSALLFGLTGGLVFFPIFFALRLFHQISAVALSIVTAVAMALFGVASDTEVGLLVPLVAAGAVGGYFAFRTLAWCAKRDESSC